MLFATVCYSYNPQRPLSNPLQATSIRIPAVTGGTSALRTLESVEAAHSSHSLNARIGRHLGSNATPVRMDSQAKYCSLARGDGDVYLRMPTGVGYREKIWVCPILYNSIPGLIITYCGS